MKTTAAALPKPCWADLEPLPQAYERLRQVLARTRWICQGTVVCRPLQRRINGQTIKKGPYYLWTRKVQGKTVCVALSQAQYALVKEAIENNRRMLKNIERMQTLTMQTILKKVPGVIKRK